MKQKAKGRKGKEKWKGMTGKGKLRGKVIGRGRNGKEQKKSKDRERKWYRKEKWENISWYFWWWNVLKEPSCNHLSCIMLTFCRQHWTDQFCFLLQPSCDQSDAVHGISNQNCKAGVQSATQANKSRAVPIQSDSKVRGQPCGATTLATLASCNTTHQQALHTTLHHDWLSLSRYCWQQLRAGQQVRGWDSDC